MNGVRREVALRGTAALVSENMRLLSRRIADAGLYPAIDPVGSLPAEAKVSILERIERLARAIDPRVIQVMAGLAAEYDVVYVARHDGVRAADVRRATFDAAGHSLSQYPFPRPLS